MNDLSHNLYLLDELLLDICSMENGEVRVGRKFYLRKRRLTVVGMESWRPEAWKRKGEICRLRASTSRR